MVSKISMFVRGQDNISIILVVTKTPFLTGRLQVGYNVIWLYTPLFAFIPWQSWNHLRQPYLAPFSGFNLKPVSGCKESVRRKRKRWLGLGPWKKYEKYSLWDRWSSSCHGSKMIKVLPWDHLFSVITGKNNMLPKTDHNGFSHNDQKIWCFGLSRILYILYTYIYIMIIYIWCYITCAIFRSRWFTKKGPQICSPCSPNSGEGCMDATGWNNSVVVPWKQRDLTINHGGVHSSTMKN